MTAVFMIQDLDQENRKSITAWSPDFILHRNLRGTAFLGLSILSRSHRT
ncbi:MAG: hypothetical protein GDA36_08820 [Rhodobacteraceae bacterium]|nr:hypothetical protein [Paracoccaceae bacterium]